MLVCRTSIETVLALSTYTPIPYSFFISGIQRVRVLKARISAFRLFFFDLDTRI
jgi:hypothetical protein